MDRWQAADAFFNSFGLTAYEKTTVPDDAVMPYATYEAAISEFEDPVMVEMSLWDRSYSWAWISRKAEEISQAVGDGTIFPMGNRQYMFVTKGNPFAQRLSDENGNVRRVYLIFNVEYFYKWGDN